MPSFGVRRVISAVLGVLWRVAVLAGYGFGASPAEIVDLANRYLKPEVATVIVKEGGSVAYITADDDLVRRWESADFHKADVGSLLRMNSDVHGLQVMKASGSAETGKRFGGHKFDVSCRSAQVLADQSDDERPFWRKVNAAIGVYGQAWAFDRDKVVSSLVRSSGCNSRRRCGDGRNDQRPDEGVEGGDVPSERFARYLQCFVGYSCGRAGRISSYPLRADIRPIFALGIGASLSLIIGAIILMYPGRRKWIAGSTLCLIGINGFVLGAYLSVSAVG